MPNGSKQPQPPRLVIEVSHEQREALRKRAAQEGLTLGAWMRRVLGLPPIQPGARVDLARNGREHSSADAKEYPRG